jgi:hypothetical protein
VKDTGDQYGFVLNEWYSQAAEMIIVGLCRVGDEIDLPSYRKLDPSTVTESVNVF